MSKGTAHATVNMPVALGKLDPAKPETAWPEGLREIRIIGCDGYRQCEVGYEFGALFLRERNKPDSHFAIIGLDTLFRHAFVALIKANDGMAPTAALEHGLKALPGFEYVTIAEETKP